MLACVDLLKLETTIIRWKNVSTCPESLIFSMGNYQTCRKMGTACGEGGKDPQAAQAEGLLGRRRRFEIQREGNLRERGEAAWAKRMKKGGVIGGLGAGGMP